MISKFWNKKKEEKKYSLWDSTVPSLNAGLIQEQFEYWAFTEQNDNPLACPCPYHNIILTLLSHSDNILNL